MEDEQVFFDTSVANLADTELNDEMADPFAPVLQTAAECRSKTIAGKEDDIKKEEPALDNSEKYKCSQCTQTYAFNSELQAHMRAVHDNKLPFSCGHCDKAYRYTPKYDNFTVTSFKNIISVKFLVNLLTFKLLCSF